MYNEEKDFDDIKFNDLEVWQDIIKSSNWRVFKDLLATHKEFLYSQVILNVRNRKFDIASDMCSRADECDKILACVEHRLKTLKQEEKENG